MLATTMRPLACAMVLAARSYSLKNVRISVGGVLLNKREKSASLLPIQRMAVVGRRAAASASSVWGLVEQVGFRIFAAITSIGYIASSGFGLQNGGRPTSAATVNPGTAKSRVCCFFGSASKGASLRPVATAWPCSMVIWGYPGGGTRGSFSETPAWVAITLA